jgi:hypothetical protein
VRGEEESRYTSKNDLELSGRGAGLGQDPNAHLRIEREQPTSTDRGSPPQPSPDIQRCCGELEEVDMGGADPVLPSQTHHLLPPPTTKDERLARPRRRPERSSGVEPDVGPPYIDTA